MPKKYPISTLQKIATSYIAGVLAEFLENHRSETCKCCNLEYLNEQCQYIQDWKMNVGSITDITKTLIYEKTYLLLYGNNLYKKNYNRRFDTFYFLTLFCASNDLRVDYVSLEDMEDYNFAKKFGKNIHGIFINRSRSQNIDCFCYTMRSANNLVMITITGFGFTDEILGSIGKYCECVKELHGDASSDKNLTAEGFLKLMFADSRTKTIRNPCCDSLQVIDLSFSFFERHGDKLSIRDCVVLLLSTITNLKTFGHYFDMDDFISVININSVKAVHFETCSIWNLQPETIEVIKNCFPNLKEMRCVVEDLEDTEMLRPITSITSIVDMSLICSHALSDSPLYEGILLNEWSNLKFLYFASSKKTTVNVSQIARNLPNLEKLFLIKILRAAWDGSAYFCRLKSLSVSICSTYQELNSFTWFKSFSQTIERIIFESKKEVDVEELLDEFRKNSYPELSKVIIKSLIFDFDKVKSLVAECAQLRVIGNFVQQTDAISRLKEYLNDNNLDCNILCG